MSFKLPRHSHPLFKVVALNVTKMVTIIIVKIIIIIVIIILIVIL